MRGALADTEHVDNTDRDHQPSSSAIYAIVGVFLFVLGGSLLANVNVNDSPDLPRTGGLLLLGIGAYATIAGAVPRGIQLARR